MNIEIKKKRNNFKIIIEKFKERDNRIAISYNLVVQSHFLIQK